MRKCIPRDFLEYFTRLLSYDVTVTRERPKESYRGRLLISSYFGDNFEIVSVVSKEIVCGCLFKDNYSTSLRVAPWQEYYKLFNKLIGSVDK